VAWTEFAPGIPLGTWTTKNLVMDPPLDPEDFPDQYGWTRDWAGSVEDWVYAAVIFYYLFGGVAEFVADAIGKLFFGEDVGMWNLIPSLERKMATSEMQARGAVRGLIRGVNGIAWSYLMFFPHEPVEPLIEDLVFSESDRVGFGCLRYGCTIAAVPGWWDEDIVVAAAPDVALRMIEGSAGASRYWWNMLAGPLEHLDRLGSSARFEFTDARAQPGPDGEGHRAWFGIESDTDCDRLPDHADSCPLLCNRDAQEDGDADGIGDVCDFCRTVPREDGDALPRLSEDHDEDPGSWRRRDDDWDRDGVGDRCDLCPRMSTGASVPREEEEAWIPETAGPSHGGADDDHDGVGNRCDNCPVNPNRDQRDCNASDEIDQELYTPGEPYPEDAQLGDACDWTPCVDQCVSPTMEVEHGPGVPLSAPDLQPLTATVCLVGANPETGAPATIPTRVRGCSCSRTERLTETCERLYCPSDGTEGRRWADVHFDGRGGPFGWLGPDLPYRYAKLYAEEPDLGYDPHGAVAYYAVPGRRKEQEWNWIDDACGGVTDGCRGSVRMWWKPTGTEGTSFPPFDAVYGNTYTDWEEVDADPPIWSGGPPEDTPPPVGPGSGVTPPGEAEESGGGGLPTMTLMDILETTCWRMGPCPRWPEYLFFDDPGSEVIGLAVSVWDAERDSLGWTLGTKIAGEQPFNLLSPSGAVAYDRNGDPNRFWLFGGVDAVGQPTDEMWVGGLVALDDTGLPSYVGSEGLPVPLGEQRQPDGDQVFFEVAPVARGNVWPSARVGAALVCAGYESATQQSCDQGCPQVDVALGLAPPPDGVTQLAGS
jgi:hypothetical protein